MPAPDRRVLEDAVFAVSDGLYHGANVVLEPAAIHAGELTERRLVVDPALSRHQLAFQHDFGVGRHHKIDGLALNELGGRAVKTAKNLEVIHIWRKALERSQLVEDGCADDHSDFEVLTLRGRLLGVDTSTMGRAGHIEPALVLGAKHGSVETPIVDACIRILRTDEGIIGIRLAVAFVMQEHREDRHVDIVPFQDAFLAWRGADNDWLDTSE